MPHRISKTRSAQLQNCWEYQRCGREPGGAHVAEFGVCPAATFDAADGFCGGLNGGRGCTYITGTFCGGYISGTHEVKAKHCDGCDFYHELKAKHGAALCVLRFGSYVRARGAVDA